MGAGLLDDHSPSGIRGSAGSQGVGPGLGSLQRGCHGGPGDLTP